MDKNLITLAIVGLVIWLILKQQPAQVSNEETWNWTDWQGNERSITVHRNVRANGD